MTMNIEPLCENFGAMVSGIDFNDPLSEADRNKLYALWLEHGILLVRGRHFSPEKQIEFSRIFGELEEHPLKTIRSKQYPELMELSSENTRTSPYAIWDGVPVIGRLPWHKDLIYTAEPNRGAVLRAVVLPEREGETGYGDQSKAYDALPAETKSLIENLQVVYRFEVDLTLMPFLDTTGYQAPPDAPRKPADVGFPDFPDSLYPLVLVHPETGRRSLNVSPMFMDHIHNMGRAEGDKILRELVAHVTRPEFTYLHSWREGDMILWDNWRFMHSAPGVRPGDRRLIHRTTILGDRALGKTLAA